MMNMFQSGPSVGRIAPAEAIAQVADGTLTLVDIRDPAERSMTGVARGAVAIPLSTFQMKADPRSPEHHADLKADKPVALYCASGARSQMAAQAMLRMGYSEVYNLGGLHDWTRAGGALD